MKRDDIKDDEKMFRRERGVRLEGWIYEVLQIHRYNGKHQIHKTLYTVTKLQDMQVIY